MAKKIKIRSESIVHVGDQVVNTEKMTEEQQVRSATMISKDFLNSYYAGKVIFTEAE